MIQHFHLSVGELTDNYRLHYLIIELKCATTKTMLGYQGVADDYLQGSAALILIYYVITKSCVGPCFGGFQVRVHWAAQE